MSDEKKSDVLKGEEHLLLDHNYDGIHELDHPLPRWWLGIFYITIVFSVWYVGYYMSGLGPNSQEELEATMAQIEAKKPAAAGAGDGLNFLNAIQNPDRLKNGNSVFAGKCLACHGDKAQGGIGPNLTDDHWLNGRGSLQDIARIIVDGVPEKGMPPWGAILTPDELTDVVAFIRSAHGSNPPGAKGPQGEAYELAD